MKKTIGRSEKVILPEFSNIEMRSKIDTGAFSNALHVDGIEKVKEGIKVWIKNPENTFIFNKYKRVEVKNSFGQKQTRWSVLTRIKLGNKTYKCYICLTKRNKMNFPMLIGRKFLYKFGYIVDVTKKNIYDTNKKV
jgi:hypothetical protein